LTLSQPHGREELAYLVLAFIRGGVSLVKEVKPYMYIGDFELLTHLFHDANAGSPILVAHVSRPYDAVYFVILHYPRDVGSEVVGYASRLSYHGGFIQVP